MNGDQHFGAAEQDLAHADREFQRGGFEGVSVAHVHLSRALVHVGLALVDALSSHAEPNTNTSSTNEGIDQ